jgi:hypothetical protein
VVLYYFFYYPARSVLEYWFRAVLFLLLPSSLGTRVLFRTAAVQQQYSSSSTAAAVQQQYSSAVPLFALPVRLVFGIFFADSMLYELLIALYCKKSRMLIKRRTFLF